MLLVICCSSIFSSKLCVCRITDGTFGHTEYFQGLVDNVNDMTKSNDWFLLANDFAGYMKAQDEVDKVKCAATPSLKTSVYVTFSSRAGRVQL